MPSQNDGVTTGSFRPQDAFGTYNNIAFAVAQAIAQMQTCTLVRVVAVENEGDLSPVGFVDVLPLVNQIDGSTPPNPTPHTTIHNLPYLRLQGGANAVIIDPEVGDLGIAWFASRDISKVKNTKDQANPGSLRQYSFSDGIYSGGLLNRTPEQYVRFSTEGIEIVSPNKIRVQAPSIEIVGDATMTGTLTVSGDVLTGSDHISSHNHHHNVGTTPTTPPLP